VARFTSNTTICSSLLGAETRESSYKDDKKKNVVSIVLLMTPLDLKTDVLDQISQNSNIIEQDEINISILNKFIQYGRTTEVEDKAPNNPELILNDLRALSQSIDFMSKHKFQQECR
jgi:hypothetical protein